MLRTSHILAALGFVALLGAAAPVAARTINDELPPIVSELKVPFEKVGQGRYRKFGFSIYHATLWAPGGTFDETKPYALELHYLRDLSQETLTDAVVDDIRDQHVTDDATMAAWEERIRTHLPAVKEDDIMVGVIMPHKGARIYLNGALLVQGTDQALGHAFLNIWLGANADEDLRDELLNKAR